MNTRAATVISRAALLLVCIGTAGPAFGLTVSLRAGAIDKTMPDGRVVPMWGFALGAGPITVPGPRIEVPYNDSSLTVNLTNNLDVPVSLVIPGQQAVMVPVKFTDSRGRQRARSFTHETAPGDTQAYSWPQLRAGTYLYHSGSHPAVQVQMGLYGSVTKNAAAGNVPYPALSYAREFVLLYSEIDPDLHDAVGNGLYGTPPWTSTMDYNPKYFLINGEPYSPSNTGIAVGPAGDQLLLRFLNAGLQTHTPVLLNASMSIVAEDGRPYSRAKQQSGVDLPSLQTKDVLVTLPTSGGCGLFDRRMATTNAGAMGPGGMIRILCTGDPISVTTAPESQTVCTGDNVTFTVAASGAAPITYQWNKDGVVLPGATSTSLTINGVDAGDTGQYEVVVSNQCGSTSAYAMLAVSPPIVITADPVSQAVCEGVAVDLSVTASSGNAPLTYQWRKGGVDVPGATASTLHFDAVTAADAGSYDVVVTGDCGATAISSPATLTVDAAPTIVTDPASQSVPEGSPVTFTVNAQGTAPLTYAWRKDGADIPGATGSSYSIAAATLADEGSYDVVVSNPCGSATSAAATLTVTAVVEPPVITTQPQSQTVAEGDPVTFTVVATGTAPLAYQWYKGAVLIPGATSDSLTIDPVTAADAGDYTVVVSNAYGTATSDPATLTVQVPSTELWMSFTANTTVPGVGTVQPCDIVAYDTVQGTWSLRFDGDAVGLTGRVIGGMAVTGGDLLLSFTAATTVPGLTGGPNGTNVDDSDIVRFTPTAWGASTAGSFSFYFDGSDVGLTTGQEVLDAIAVAWDGRLVISTTGNATPTTGDAGADEDLLSFTATSTGAATSGSFSLWFEGGDVALGAGGEDIDAAAAIPAMTLLLSTQGNFNVPGLSGSSGSVVEFTPGTLGPTTAGTFSLYVPAGTVPAGANVGSLEYVVWPF